MKCYATGYLMPRHKLFSLAQLALLPAFNIVAAVYRQRHLVKATEVTAGLAESVTFSPSRLQHRGWSVKLSQWADCSSGLHTFRMLPPPMPRSA